jgi:hypothetical protein
MLQRLEDAGAPKIAELTRLWHADRRGPALALIDEALSPALGFERAEILKGLLNRFPVRPSAILAPNDCVAPGEAAASQTPQRMEYQPIPSLGALRSFGSTLDGVAGLLRLLVLAQGAEGKGRLHDLDRQLMTALARVLSGGELRDQALTAGETEKLVELPQQAAQTVTNDFFAAVESSLRAGLAETAGEDRARTWSVSRAAGILVEDPVQPVMAELSDLVLRLEAARAEMKAHGGSLAHLIDLKSSAECLSQSDEATRENQ